MDISAQLLTAMMRTYTTAWQDGLLWKPSVNIDFLFREFPSTTAGNFYAWLDMQPGFREWAGDRQFNNVRSQAYEVLNRLFEKSLRMPFTAIMNDQYHVYGPIINGFAGDYNQLLHDLVIEVLTSNKITYTGKALCADDHPYGENLLDNLSNAAFTEAVFNAAIAASAEWKFANDALVKPNWTHLAHGPKLRSTAFHVIDAEFHADGGVQVNNPNFKRVTRVELPELAGAYDDYWFLLDCSRPIKPIALQIRERPNPIMDTDPSHVERTGNYDWMAHAQAAAAPTFPHMVYGGIL